MPSWLNILLIELSLLFFTGNFTYSQNGADKYVNPDVTAVYSTHPERPFRYGFPYERDNILQSFEDSFNAYEIRSGDVVVEVGAASGWLEGVFSVFSDSVVYYIQDIDTNVLNKNQFDAVIEHFSAQRDTPQTNNFHFVIGTETSTNLPEAKFDLVLINNTFHEFTEVGQMMNDIVTKLKPDGRLVICESFANDDMKVRHGGCNKKAYMVSRVEELLEPAGLYLTKMEYPEYSTFNYLTFERNKEKAEKYREWLNEIDPLLSDLNSLNLKKVCKSDEKMSWIQSSLEADLVDILEYFPSLTHYFFSLAEVYIESYKYNCAIRVMETCVDLFPDDPESITLLADAYYASGLYDYAVDYYQTATDLDSTDTYARCSAILSYVGMHYFDDAHYEYQMALMVDSTDDFVHSCAGDLYLAIIEADVYPFSAEFVKNDLYYELSLDREDLLSLAIESYTKAITFDPLNPYYYISRADAYERQSEYEQALEEYNYAIYLYPNDYEFYSLRAVTKLQLGDEEGYEDDLLLFKSIKKKFR